MSLIGASTVLQFHMVAPANRRELGVDAKHLAASPHLIIEPWTTDLLGLAREAFTRFGKGQGHPARLNFGDWMSHALAKSLDAPLLYTGDDFARTDIRSAI